MNQAITTIISDPGKDPLGTMLLDYLDGDLEAALEVESAYMDMWQMEASIMFRSFPEMDRLEKHALLNCRGSVLDVGAGSGCHSICLQKQGFAVTPIDISPGCVQVMHKRRLVSAEHRNLFSISGRTFDTILMLMNGIGICGTLDGVNLFLQYVDSILSENGQILVDSTELEPPGEEEADPGDGYYGETRFVMCYGQVRSDPFDWVYLDYATLKRLAGFHSFHCECLISEEDGRFLARLYR